MTAAYNITLEAGTPGFSNVKVGFGDPASNDVIVVDANAKAKELATAIAGTVVLVNGPASLPVAMNLAHAWCHVAKAIACFDPKLSKYVVAISHDPAFAIGQLI